jgi:hypothetical protein
MMPTHDFDAKTHIKQSLPKKQHVMGLPDGELRSGLVPSYEQSLVEQSLVSFLTPKTAALCKFGCASVS